MESIVGKILCDRYRIIQELNRDGVSTVYLAEDLEQRDRSSCEIERILPQYDREVLGAKSWRKVRQTLMEQGNLLQNISQHRQIPQVLAYFECDREFYLVREHIEGETLAQQVERSPISEAEAVSWLQEILSVLEFIHQAGIIHLNIQPSSLVQHQDGSKYLINFAGIKYAIAGERASLTAIANPDFMATQPSAKPDFSSDIYALGKTIIYALTSKVAGAIRAKSAALENTTESLEAEPIPTAQIAPQLANVLNKMVGERAVGYRSAAEVLAELDFDRNVVTLPPPFLDPAYFGPKPSAERSKFSWAAIASRSKGVRRVLWFLLALPFAIAAILIFIGIDKNSERNFITYTNNDYQFDIKYPPGWTRQELNDPITGEIVVFTSPAESDSDLFLEKVYLTIEYLPSEPITLDEYSQLVLERIELTDNSEIRSDFSLKINGLPARAIVYSRQEGELQLRQMEVFTIKNDRIYLAIYTAQQAKFDKFLDTADRIIDSWAIN